MVTFGNDYIGVWRNGERKNTLSFVHSIFSHKIERLSPLEIDQINKMWNQKVNRSSRVWKYWLAGPWHEKQNYLIQLLKWQFTLIWREMRTYASMQNSQNLLVLKNFTRSAFSETRLELSHITDHHWLFFSHYSANYQIFMSNSTMVIIENKYFTYK